MAYSGFLQIAPGEVTANDATPTVNPGSLAMINGKIYQYVQFDNGDGNVAAAAGALCYWYDVSTFTVTSDYSYAGTSLNLVAGVFQTVLTDGYYGWMQVYGRYSTVKTDGGDDIAKGDTIIAAAADGVCNSITANSALTNKVVGWALADDVNADNTVDVFLTLMSS